MSVTSRLVRAMFRRGDEKRDAGLTTPADIRRFDDIAYGPDPQWNVLDVYRPRAAAGALPVIVSVHGGGWVYGDKERYQYYCMSLAQQGFAVVNFTYRLAPEHKFPAPVKDTDRVFAWVRDHAAAYGFDPRAVFAVGDSAGAHLLAMYCCLCADPAYAAQLGLARSAGFAPRAVALNCGVYRLEKKPKKDPTPLLLADYLPGRGSARELALLDVTAHLTRAFPPAFVMTAQGDFLAAQAEPFARAVNAAGGTAQYRYYGGEGQVLGHVFHCNIRSAAAQRCNRDECDFFKKYLPAGAPGPGK